MKSKPTGRNHCIGAPVGRLFAIDPGESGRRDRRDGKPDAEVQRVTNVFPAIHDLARRILAVEAARVRSHAEHGNEAGALQILRAVLMEIQCVLFVENALILNSLLLR